MKSWQIVLIAQHGAAAAALIVEAQSAHVRPSGLPYIHFLRDDGSIALYVHEDRVRYFMALPESGEEAA